MREQQIELPIEHEPKVQWAIIGNKKAVKLDYYGNWKAIIVRELQVTFGVNKIEPRAFHKLLCTKSKILSLGFTVLFNDMESEKDTRLNITPAISFKVRNTGKPEPTEWEDL